MNASILALALLSTATAAALAAPNDGIVGSYLRVEGGQSNFGVSGSLPRTSSDDHAQAAKLYGGYRFNDNFGLEIGYAALGTFSESVVVGGTVVRQDGKASSVFGAATGRLPLNESFALHGRLGLSSGKVRGTDRMPQGDTLTGGKTSVLFGLGAEYRPQSNMALTINYDRYGRLTNRVQANTLVFGFHFTL